MINSSEFLQPSMFLYWRNQIYRLIAIDWHSLHIQGESLENGTIQSIEMTILWADTDGTTPLFADTVSNLQSLIIKFQSQQTPTSSMGVSETLLSRATIIIELVETIRLELDEAQMQARIQGKTFAYTSALKNILKKHPIGLTTYYKYRKLYDEHHGDRASIATSLHRSTFGQTRMTATQLHLVDQVILRYGARRPPRTPKVIYNIITSILKRTRNTWVNPQKSDQEIPDRLLEGLFDHQIPIDTLLEHPEYQIWFETIHCPSQSWFYTYFRWFQAQPELGRGVFTARYGRQAWENELMVFDSFAHVATMPLQYVFADHWLVDVFSVDDQTRQQRRRLWLTALIDTYSRCILGICLLDQAPSIQSIQFALRHTIWLKTSHTDLGIEGQWSCFGIPQQLFLDNAWAHHAYSLEDLARSISYGGQYTSIDLVFRPPYRGRYGALIERFFGNLSARMKTELKGAITSQDPLQVRRAAQEAILLYDDVNRFIHQEILAYQHHPHPELGGMTPHEKWCEWMESVMPKIPPLTDGTTRLFWHMEPRPRVINRGISIFGMQYTSPELSQIEQIDRQGKRVKYHVRFDPDDISRVALFRDGYWVCDVYAKPLRQPDGQYRKISLAQRRLAQTALRQTDQSSRNWLSYINDNEELFRQRQHEQKRAIQTPTHKSPVFDIHAMEQELDRLDTQQRQHEQSQLLTDFLGKQDHDDNTHYDE
jgi:transposase InsO family protein